jgi:lysozyme family protein
MSIKEIIAAIIKREGGYVNHPNDKGGPTCYGITAMSYTEYFSRPGSNITREKALAGIISMSPQLAEKIYYTLYYIRPKIDALPDMIRPFVLDTAVNHGRRGAVKILQQSLINAGYSHDIPDGIIGERTIKAATKAIDNLGKNFIIYLIEARITAYKTIIAKDPTQAVFEEGWIARAKSFRAVTV